MKSYKWVIERCGERAPLVYLFSNIRRKARVLSIGEKGITATFRQKNGKVVVVRRKVDQVMIDFTTAEMFTMILTACGSYHKLLHAPNGYRPTLLGGGAYRMLARRYDFDQAQRMDPRRAHTGGPVAA